MSDLGKAYVQIIPSAKGIQGAITKELAPEGDSAGLAIGKGLVGKLKGVIAAAGIGTALKAAISEGADIEQSLGGVETLFKSSADKIKESAKTAYMTAGQSANSYMENITSFSASLIQSTAGDTDRAADVAHMAMVDMSDNANKMGSNMADIQNAYQGFSKQNYTMLDNLKLGYGGTKTEMERLLADATKLSGVEYDISNLADVYEAVHVIQEEIGITGTTALEAEKTVSGSFNMMKASFQNVLGALATGFGFQEAIKGLADSTATFIFGNLIPMIWEIVKALPGALIGFVQAFTPHLIQAGTEFVTFLANGITTGLPALLTKGTELIQNLITGFTSGQPLFSENIMTFFAGIGEFITTQLPLFVSKGMELLSNFAQGVVTNFPILYEQFLQGISGLIAYLSETLPQWVMKGFDLIVSIGMGILQGIPGAIGSLMDLLTSLFGVLIDNMPTILEHGRNLIVNLANGIIERIPTVLQNIGKLLADTLSTIVQKLPEFLSKGIELIKKIAEGIGKTSNTAVQSMFKVLTAVLGEIARNLPQILAKGVELIAKLAAGIIRNLPAAISAIGQILKSILSAILNFAGQILQAGVTIILKFIQGIGQTAGQVFSKIGEILSGIINRIRGFIGQMIDAGYNLLMGLATGISNAVSGVIRRAVEAAKGVVSAVKNFFGIRSPSRVFMEIGAYLDEGLAEGITGNIKPVQSAMDQLSATASGTFQADMMTTSNYSGLGQVESSNSALGVIIKLLELLLKKDGNIYLDRDKLIGYLIDEIDSILADKQQQSELSLGGV